MGEASTENIRDDEAKLQQQFVLRAKQERKADAKSSTGLAVLVCRNISAHVGLSKEKGTQSQRPPARGDAP